MTRTRNMLDARLTTLAREHLRHRDDLVAGVAQAADDTGQRLERPLLALVEEERPHRPRRDAAQQRASELAGSRIS